VEQEIIFILVIIGAIGIVIEGMKKMSGNNARKSFNRFSTKKQLFWEHQTL
jgi:hypothetical protein